jgi:FAD/FMN-containing dehydrogenase
MSVPGVRFPRVTTTDWRPLADEVGLALPDAPGYTQELFCTLAAQNPAAVVTPTGVADIRAAVRFAAGNDLPVAVRATGHGSYPSDDALLLNTGLLAGLRVDPAARTARVEPGVRSGTLVREAAAFGLAPLNGASPIVGVVGYTLGGGLGPLGRAHGYAADLVRELDVVTADGELVTASPEREPELFWATRGGKGNFGVVTSMEIDLVEMPRLYAGNMFLPGEAAADVLHAYREWTATLPDATSSSVALIRLPPIEQLPEFLRGRFVIALRFTHPGPAEEGAELLAPMRAVATPLTDSVRDMPYAEVATIHDDPTDPGAFVDRTGVLRELSAATVDALLDVAGPDRDFPSVVELRHLGGALSRPPAHGNAVPFRDAAFSLFMVGMVGPDGTAPVHARHDGLVDALSPWRIGPYAPFVGAVEAGQLADAYDPATYARLRAAKATYDPANLFRANANIPPA